jgi:cell division protein FtsB
MNVNYTIPLWSILTFIIPVIWGLIRMYFNQIQMKKDIVKQEEDNIALRDNIMGIKKEIEDKLDRHKQATDAKLEAINSISIETRTLVKLLVDNKIVK